MTSPNASYIATVPLRDAQYARTADPDPLDDELWADYPDAEAYLGQMSGRPDEVRTKFASYAGTDPGNIRLVEIAAPIPATEANADGKLAEILRRLAADAVAAILQKADWTLAVQRKNEKDIVLTKGDIAEYAIARVALSERYPDCMEAAVVMRLRRPIDGAEILTRTFLLDLELSAANKNWCWD